ncbi:MAG: endonuclease/exonuclease/phosphatase family protein [Prevotella sp.]|nr:endonuclease/exonuclease/phosphatase family protein [Prevotella sp.]
MLLGLLLSTLFTFVELNCENLFDTEDDSLKQDEEFLPTSTHRWTTYRYWQKLNRVGQTILSCGVQDSMVALPDLIALTEIENDSVMRDLTRRSVIRNARYAYVMTDSPDERGIDVALVYSPYSFKLLSHRSIRIPPLSDFRPTRDILQVSGEIVTGDTLHVFVVHAPSRSGGEKASRPYRQHVARQLCAALDSLRLTTSNPRVIIAGDFNDYARDPVIRQISGHGLAHVSAAATGRHGAKGTYRFQGEWGSLDHIFCDPETAASMVGCRINDAPFLLVDDEKYGGKKPRRNYQGPRYLNGFSDHLPLVAVFDWGGE